MPSRTVSAASASPWPTAIKPCSRRRSSSYCTKYGLFQNADPARRPRPRPRFQPVPLALPDQAEEALRQFLRGLHLGTLLHQPLDDGGLLGGDGLFPPDQPPDGGARRGRWGAWGGFAAGLAPRAPLPRRQLRSPPRYRPIDGGR